jgi:hypothetical protein
MTDEQQEYFKLLFQPAPEPVKAVETEALQTRLRTYFVQFVQRAAVSASNETARSEAVTAALAMQHGLDDLTLVTLSTHALLNAARNESEQNKGPVHPAWKKFIS